MNAQALTLWHASDDPHIEIFHPHRAPTAQLDDDLVWAVDDAHVPAYWFPRDCPRATFWIGPKTTPEDVAFLNGGTRVHAIERDWWDRFRAARVHLYLMPSATFTVHPPEVGYYVSREIRDVTRARRHRRPRGGARDSGHRATSARQPVAALGPRDRVVARVQRHPPAERAAAAAGPRQTVTVTTMAAGAEDKISGNVK